MANIIGMFNFVPRTLPVLLKMTTFRQGEYEAITQHIREQEEKKRKEENKGGNNDLKTSKTMASPKNMLTDKELECVTAVFRSFETGLRGATINPCVSCNPRIADRRNIFRYILQLPFNLVHFCF